MLNKGWVKTAVAALAIITASTASAAWYQDPSYSFESAYMSLLLGGGNLKGTEKIIFPSTSNSNSSLSPIIQDSRSTSKSSPLAGLDLGMGASFNRWYFGAAVSSLPVPFTFGKTGTTWVGQSGIPYNSSLQITDVFNADALLGYYLSHCVLFYLRGGAAFGYFNYKQIGWLGANYNYHKVACGPHLGVGLDYSFTPHWSVGVDYTYTDFFKQSFVTSPNSITGLTTEFQASAKGSQVLLHIRYNWLM